MRAFVAIELPEEVREALGELAARLRRGGARATWVRPERMHLTLRFLGEVAPETAEHYAESLAGKIRPCGAARLRVAGTGAFPNLRRPNVVWAGAECLEGDLAALHAAAEHAARAAGLEADSKRFHPHITLARIRDRRRLGTLCELLENERDFDAGAFDATRLVLLESKLTPRGPEYHHLEEFALP